MAVTVHEARLPARPAPRRRRLPCLRPGGWPAAAAGELRRNGVLYLMVLPGLVYFLVFRYGPMYGALIAFKDYRILDGITGSPWVGLAHFREAFGSTYFAGIVANTVLISVYKLVFGLPPAIVMALLLNEVRARWFRRTVQTITYLPHFLSWVVISGVLLAMLAPTNGLVNKGIAGAGFDPIAFLANPDWFRTVLVASDIWRNVGWGAIVYLAALASIPPELYEAAAIDGAGRLRRIRDVGLPGIRNVVVLVTLISIGSIMSAGFEQVFVLYNPAVYGVGDIVDTWVYRQGITAFQFSTAAAVGLVKGVVGLVLIVVANWAAKRWTDSGIW